MRVARLVFALLVVASPAAAQDHTDGWQVDQAGQTCKLTAEISGGGVVELSRTSTIPKIRIQVSPDPMPPSGLAGETPVRIGGIIAWHVLDNKDAPAISIVVNTAEAEQLLSPGLLHISASGSDIAISVPSGSAAMREFDACLARVRRAGYEPGAPPTTLPRRLPDPKFQSRMDRLAESFGMHFFGGAIRLTLAVGPDGRALGCTSVEASGVRQMPQGDMVCRMMMTSARFAPALDAEGKPTIGDYTVELTWRD